MIDKSLLILNGPGLADLSNNDAAISLDIIHEQCVNLCQQLGISLTFFQTDDEDEMFGYIVKEVEHYDALVINPIGYSRAASVPFEMYRSAIKMIAHLQKPVVEIHITNIFSPGVEIAKPLQSPEGAMGFICGMGINSYLLAIRHVATRLNGGVG